MMQHTKDDNESVVLSQLDKIPPTVINKIATYLDSCSYHSFMQCNQIVYTATQSPYQPVTIPYHVIDGYVYESGEIGRPIDPYKFARLQEVHFSHREPDLWIQFVWRQLRTLSLQGHTLKHIIASFHSKNIEFEHLRKLKIYCFNAGDNSSFNMLLPHIPNLQFLEMRCSDAPNIYPRNQHLFKKIHGLSLLCKGAARPQIEINDILDLCGSNLVALKTDVDFMGLNINPILFPHLNEIILRDLQSKTLMDKIGTFPLKTFSFNHDVQGHRLESNHLSTQFMNKLFGIKQLEIVKFQDKILNFPKLTKLIQNALMVNPKKKRLLLYIRCINGYTNAQGDARIADIPIDAYLSADFALDVEILANALDYLIDEDFMLVLDGLWTGEGCRFECVDGVRCLHEIVDGIDSE
eukprot:450739_1